MTDAYMETPAEGDPKGPPLLFVHGAWHGAWCWEPLMNYISFKGRHSYALDLPGHGELRSEGTAGLQISDYVGALARFVERHFENPPVLIGHAMGGLIVQKYLERKTAPAAVLLAPCPAIGAGLDLLFKFSFYLPITGLEATVGATATIKSPKDCRRLFFHRASPENVRAVFNRLGPESSRALRQMVLPGFKITAGRIGPDTPTAVFAAGRDFFFSHSRLKKWAEDFGYDFVSFPDEGHNLMFGPGYKQVGDELDRWLAAKLG